MSECRSSVNETQETTGYNGSLPDSEYDITCPAIPGGEYAYKKNYFADSCQSRLDSADKNIKCTYGKRCPRFTGDEPQKSGRENTCARCDEFKWISGRGLCQKCSRIEKADGTIDNWPKAKG